MSPEKDPEHLPSFQEKMRQEGLPEVVIETFSHHYRQLSAGETGMIPDAGIAPLEPDEIPTLDAMAGYAEAGEARLRQTIQIVLNGGLGTSMGLTGPKSLLEVKDGHRFLDLILRQAESAGIRLAFMNSFNTDAETRGAVTGSPRSVEPLHFLQHKFPKVLRADLSPAAWPENPDLEWNPPGHGDIYTALHTSGMLRRLLEEGIRYAFVANSDNLGAVMNPSLLGYFSRKGFPFMMEVARRTPSDLKGGHLARSRRDGRLLLREIAQCPEEDIAAFQDIERFRFFNTNTLWLHLPSLQALIDKEGIVRLPMIRNPKTLDPRDPSSPEVYQIETAMGAAVHLFEGAAAVQVPSSRFHPVKKCNDLLAVRSDRFLLDGSGRLVENPERVPGRIRISLDPAVYTRIDRFDARFPEGPPSLKDCRSLSVTGDVRFEGGVTARGDVSITCEGPGQGVVPRGSVLEGEVVV